MEFLDKVKLIILNGIPILLMIGLVPLIQNDYYLAGAYILIIIVVLFIKYEPNDHLFLLFGLIAITAAEYLFVSTGVETFNRNSLFGIMPIWLPVLWAYAFVAVRRGVTILDS